MPVHFRIAQGLVEMACKHKGEIPGWAVLTLELCALFSRSRAVVGVVGADLLHPSMLLRNRCTLLIS